ncbi:hypothetical protein SPFL3102_03583 [Sporomusaceae bacterium FL31]|nr:hypothetical protein SPFL3101_00422 [Sporomusaceae bacterium FL31]GCE35732.1 hypothetical protein SPFL3102_03583 [Sporomusaceae bacterium]
MCWGVAAAQAGLGVISSVMGARAQSKAVAAQAQAAITSMNRDFMNLEIQRQDAFDATVQEITKTRLNAAQVNASVQVAINEDLGDSNTGRLLMRSVQADEARNVSALKDQYTAKSNEIDLNKESSLLSTKSYIASIPKPSSGAVLMNIASNVMGAYTSAKTEQYKAKSAGMDWDYWKGPIKKG